MENQPIENLLSEVTAVNIIYNKIKINTGVNFNIFSVLRMQSDEVRLHTRLIGDLLNPKGLHGQGSIFLSSFIKTLGINSFNKNEYNENQLENAIVKIEEYIGEVPKDFSVGGSIDIVIKPESGKKIIIENKIFAEDKRNQLIRYKQYYPYEHLFYLTLFGTPPDEKSIKDHSINKNLNTNVDFSCISYEKDVLKWLETIIKETINFPMLHETIHQYINLIKTLTNQSINHKMKKEISSILSKSSENVKAALIISGAISDMKLELIRKLVKNLETKLKLIKKEVNINYDIDAIGKKDSEIKFYVDNENDLFVSLYFLTDFANPVIGIRNSKKYAERSYPASFLPIIKNELSKINIGKREEWNWLWLSRYDALNIKLTAPEGLSSIANGDFEEITNDTNTYIIQMLAAISKLEEKPEIS